VLALALSLARNTAIGSIQSGVVQRRVQHLHFRIPNVPDSGHGIRVGQFTRRAFRARATRFHPQNAAISKAFISFSTANTLPFSTYLSSLVDTGPCKVLSCCPQPKLSELPWQERRWLFAIAGIGRRRMMGFMVITFIVAFIAFGTSLLRLTHKG
jgi:hypothetical protein